MDNFFVATFTSFSKTCSLVFSNGIRDKPLEGFTSFFYLYIKKPASEAFYSFLSMRNVPHSQVKRVGRQKHLMRCVINVLSCQIPCTERYRRRITLKEKQTERRLYPL